jgi:hypothetical protein
LGYGDPKWENSGAKSAYLPAAVLFAGKEKSLSSSKDKYTENADTLIQFHCFMVAEKTLSSNRTFFEIPRGSSRRGIAAAA